MGYALSGLEMGKRSPAVDTADGRMKRRKRCAGSTVWLAFQQSHIKEIGAQIDINTPYTCSEHRFSIVVTNVQNGETRVKCV